MFLEGFPLQYAVLPQVARFCRSDLADNWNINIATELEDYLEELETIQISLDGGKTNLNFAEAALVIQVRTVPVIFVSPV